MDRDKIHDGIKKYYEKVVQVYKLGNIESAYYTPIIELFSCFGCEAHDLSGERAGHVGENVDIKVWHNNEIVTENTPFAVIEAKRVEDFDKRAYEQVKNETARYVNVILTNNLEWHFYRENGDRMYSGVQLIEKIGNELVLREDNIDLYISIVEDFLLKMPTQLKSSSKLAEYMAIHARTIRSIVVGILRCDDDGNPVVNDKQKKIPMFLELYGLFNRIKTDLSPEMDSQAFADMYAQTIVYGLFIARYNDTSQSSFDKYEAIRFLQEESELLKQFFLHITSSGGKHPMLESVVEKLCSLYAICNISELLGRNEHKDTIIHFYEEFLTYYDPSLRKSLGVFYTPVEAVHYLISKVDNILVNEFNILGGLSNNDQMDIKVPCDPYKTKKQWHEEKIISVPRVAILDPACGTGSFGAEIIKYVKDTYFSGSRSVFYENYIQQKNSLLSRLIGFEIMMTSYVVAHLKIRRTIDETLGHVPDVQLPTNIFLTNTLAPPRTGYERNEQITLFDFSAAINDEAYHADTWKIRRPIKVIIGNPPYLAASTNPYDISAYKTETDGVTDFKERKHWLNDDYVKFFRFAEQIINKNKDGILAYVSNNGYLDNPTFRGMRASLLRSFDKIYIVNLHGSANKKEVTPDGKKDENIFSIMQGVSLFIGVKSSSKETWGKVYYADLWGSKKEKLNNLLIGDFEFEELKIDKKMAYFIPIDTSDKDVYEKGIGVAELFPVNVTGMLSGNDDVAIAPTKQELMQRINWVNNVTDIDQISELWGKFSRGQTAQKIYDDVLSDGIITPIAFRPFDNRWTYYSGNSCGWVLWPREKKTMGHLLKGPTCPVEQNFGLVFCKTSRSFFAPFVSNTIIAHRLFSSMCEITYIAPLYLHSENAMWGEEWIPNVDDEKYKILTQYLDYTPSPVEVFHYVYGILHDPVYCKKYNQYLCRDFPRVPIINEVPNGDNNSFRVNEEMYKKYVEVGGQLCKLHLMQTNISKQLRLEPETSESIEIGAIKYKDKILQLNENKSILGISSEVWQYQIGGYQVLEKWFKSHKGEILTIESFSHIERVVGIIDETIRLEKVLEDLHNNAI